MTVLLQLTIEEEKVYLANLFSIDLQFAFFLHSCDNILPFHSSCLFSTLHALRNSVVNATSLKE